MDRYIAKNLEQGTSLILAQHGGNYFQQKCIMIVSMNQKFLTDI